MEAVLTIRLPMGTRRRLERAGADDCLVKPFSAHELLALVRTQLELSRLRRQAASQHERLLTLFEVAPAAMAVVRGPTHIYEFANQRYFQPIGRSDVIGMAGRDALPELVRQSTWDLFDRVYATGEPFTAHEYPAQLDRLGDGTLDQCYFDFVLQPLKDARNRTEGILVQVIEVTESVLARQRVEEARQEAESASRGQGRVPGRAGTRAAQSAGADPDGAAADDIAWRRRGAEGARHHRAPSAARRAPGGRPARRLENHARKD